MFLRKLARIFLSVSLLAAGASSVVSHAAVVTEAPKLVEETISLVAKFARTSAERPKLFGERQLGEISEHAASFASRMTLLAPETKELAGNAAWIKYLDGVDPELAGYSKRLLRGEGKPLTEKEFAKWIDLSAKYTDAVPAEGVEGAINGCSKCFSSYWKKMGVTMMGTRVDPNSRIARSIVKNEALTPDQLITEIAAQMKKAGLGGHENVGAYIAKNGVTKTDQIANLELFRLINAAEDKAASQTLDAADKRFALAVKKFYGNENVTTSAWNPGKMMNELNAEQKIAFAEELEQTSGTTFKRRLDNLRKRMFEDRIAAARKAGKTDLATELEGHMKYLRENNCYGLFPIK